MNITANSQQHLKAFKLVLHAYNKEIIEMGENSEQLQIFGALKIFKAFLLNDSK